MPATADDDGTPWVHDGAYVRGRANAALIPPARSLAAAAAGRKSKHSGKRSGLGYFSGANANDDDDSQDGGTEQESDDEGSSSRMSRRARIAAAYRRRGWGAGSLCLCVICFFFALALIVSLVATVDKSSSSSTPAPTAPPAESAGSTGVASTLVATLQQAALAVSALVTLPPSAPAAPRNDWIPREGSVGVPLVELEFLCNVPLPDGKRCLSLFTYENHGTDTLVLPVAGGAANIIEPAYAVAAVGNGPKRTQEFRVGENFGGASVTWRCRNGDNSPSRLAWTLASGQPGSSSTAIALAEAVECPGLPGAK